MKNFLKQTLCACVAGGMAVTVIGPAGCSAPNTSKPIASLPATDGAVSPFVDLYEVGHGRGAPYTSIRIPSLAVSADGTILCWVVGRRSTSDWADMDLLLSRSKDNGKTWSDPEVFVKGEGKTVDNATNIVSDGGKTIHFLYQQNYARLLYRVSHDGGATFSETRDITEPFIEARKTLDYNWSVIAPGPGSGIQLRSGRLVAPIWLCNSGSKSHRPSEITTVYSDDAGTTWKVGEVLAKNTEQMPNPSESVLLALPDGRVMLNGRCESREYRRFVCYSDDGATGWTAPKFVPELFDPICHVSMAVVPPRGDRTEPLLAFVNPDSRSQPNIIRPWGARPRENLTLHLSRDGGKTWPIAQVIDTERAAYSAVAVAPDGKLVVAFERGPVPGNDLNLRYFSAVRIDIDHVLAPQTR